MLLLYFLLFLLKLLLTTSIYSVILFCAIKLYSVYKPNRFLERPIKGKTWFVGCLTAAFIYIGLFIFSFSYWGSRGYFSNRHIPIGNSILIQADYSNNYIFPSSLKYPDVDNTQVICIRDYIVVNNKVCAKYGKVNNLTPDGIFIVYNIDTRECLKFNDEKEYTDYARLNNLPLQSEFYDFGKHYHEYWSGWRFWFYP